MTTEHTPGPWTVASNGDDGARVNAFATVAWCPTSAAFGVDGSQVISADEAEANARLIAAAPELLAACEVFIEAERRAEVNGREGFGLYTEAMSAARAAVAKARGEP